MTDARAAGDRVPVGGRARPSDRPAAAEARTAAPRHDARCLRPPRGTVSRSRSTARPIGSIWTTRSAARARTRRAARHLDRRPLRPRRSNNLRWGVQMARRAWVTPGRRAQHAIRSTACREPPPARETLVSRNRSSLTYSGRGIPPRGVAHRSFMPNKLALRALRSGRRAGIFVTELRIRDTRSWASSPRGSSR